jgi:thioredoxin reductase (NADPH)
MTTYDIAIIGAGPAGASAAIFTARAKASTLLLDDDRGMTRKALINNHLGFEEGIKGPDLVDKGLAHAHKAGATHVKAKVTSVERDDSGFTLVCEDNQTFRAKELILCLGANCELGKRAGAEPRAGTEPYIKEVLVVDEQGKTTVPGIWAAGTCAGTSVHTIVTSGDGARVALNYLSKVKGTRYVDHDSL